MSVKLDDVERRFLNHLPIWRSPEELQEVIRLETEGHRPEEIDELLKNPTTDDPREGTQPDPAVIGSGDPRIVYGCGISIQSYSTPDFYRRLTTDEFLPMYLAKRVIETGVEAEHFTMEYVQRELEFLKNRGFVSDDGGEWTMTKAGLDALTETDEATS